MTPNWNCCEGSVVICRQLDSESLPVLKFYDADSSETLKW